MKESDLYLKIIRGPGIFKLLNVDVLFFFFAIVSNHVVLLLYVCVYVLVIRVIWLLTSMFRLQLQVDNGLNHNMRPKFPAPAPSLTPMDFPALGISNSPAQFGGDDVQQTGHHYQSAGKDNMFFFKSVSQPGSVDYVSAVKKLASQDSGLWKYEGNDSGDSSIGSSRNYHASLGGAYKSGRGKSMLNQSPNRPTPVAWLETGDAVGISPPSPPPTLYPDIYTSVV